MPVLTPDELINLAMEEIVEVEGKTNIDLTKCQLLCTQNDTFDQNSTNYDFKISTFKPSRIPLWMALHLQKRNQVVIKIPQEYNMVDNFIEREETADSFCEIPPRFFEIAIILNLQDFKIEKLKQLRMKKIWKGLEMLDNSVLFINNFTRWEFNQIKEFLTNVYKESVLISTLKDDE
ncbi:hypothetical protein EHP00_1523 [Ecytonucleospora hepatopenaei]|uniref:Uncharacterized protein n=1 Tax=Ecytonucleospora hepatopenaei TaxID=646526 RepID=A0A1W0E3W8_9MICR|nr:hypothetical protein EHP00_1523 [Ecytonucleospora hepatopenaei]